MYSYKIILCSVFITCMPSVLTLSHDWPYEPKSLICKRLDDNTTATAFADSAKSSALSVYFPEINLVWIAALHCRVQEQKNAESILNTAHAQLLQVLNQSQINKKAFDTATESVRRSIGYLTLQKNPTGDLHYLQELLSAYKVGGIIQIHTSKRSYRVHLDYNEQYACKLNRIVATNPYEGLVITGNETAPSSSDPHEILIDDQSPSQRAASILAEIENDEGSVPFITVTNMDKVRKLVDKEDKQTSRECCSIFSWLRNWLTTPPNNGYEQIN